MFLKHGTKTSTKSNWWPQRDSNPCFSLERARSSSCLAWTSEAIATAYCHWGVPTVGCPALQLRRRRRSRCGRRPRRRLANHKVESILLVAVDAEFDDVSAAWHPRNCDDGDGDRHVEGASPRDAWWAADLKRRRAYFERDIPGWSGKEQRRSILILDCHFERMPGIRFVPFNLDKTGDRE